MNTTVRKNQNKKAILPILITIIISIIIISLLIISFQLLKNFYNNAFFDIFDNANTKSINIVKNAYNGLWSFDSVIEQEQLADIVGILDGNSDIGNKYFSINTPAFLSIRKASAYVDVTVASYISEDDIIEGSMYDESRLQVIIGKDLIEKYEIPNKSIIALITKDSRGFYNANNFYVSGIASFNDPIKDNKVYMPFSTFSRIGNITNTSLFTQMIEFDILNADNTDNAVAYIKENIDTNNFEIIKNTYKEQVFVKEDLNRLYKSMSLIFMIVGIFVILSLASLIIFWFRNSKVKR